MAYTSQQQQNMLDIVSESLYAAIRGDLYNPPPEKRAGLESESGCFVTLKTNGMLRGCIGCFVSDQPLYNTLVQYARASLLEDPRFAGRRISEQELPDVAIDISVLTPLKPCADPDSIRLGRDGIYIRSVQGSGCFLPQVATETGWSVEEFWGNCCSQKAGLGYYAWRDEDIELYTFEAEIIEGKYSK